MTCDKRRMKVVRNVKMRCRTKSNHAAGSDASRNTTASPLTSRNAAALAPASKNITGRVRGYARDNVCTLAAVPTHDDIHGVVGSLGEWKVVGSSVARS
jgi:hypothetical protein